MVRNFGSNGFAGIAPLSLGIPTAAYPGRVATNSDLIVAVDRQQTSLLLPLSATSTTMTVLDPSMIVAYNLLSVDNEIVKTTGAPTGNIVPISRGFDGTIAAAHLSGATVSGLVDAWHHNALVAEIEAIEQALGPNLSQIPTSLPFLVSSNYIFAAQTPGGSLVVGNNSITLTPVPLGVNGSDQNHYLYISGGTGTPEAALITGGTAVSGAASGTVIVNCANTHSGAWTIQTATAGIQEAVNQLPAGGMVVVPAGTWNVYAPTTVATDYICIRGVGGGAFIQANHNTGSIFYFNQIGNGTGGPHGWFNGLYDIRIFGPATPGSLTAVLVRGQLGIRIVDNDIKNVYQGIWVNDTSGAVSSGVFIHRNMILNVPQGGVAIRLTGGADHFILNNHTTSGSTTTPAAVGILLEQTLGTKIIANELYTFGVGIQMSPGAGMYVATIESIDNWYDSCQGDGMKLVPQGTGVVSEIRSTHDRLAACTGNGISILGTAANILGVIVTDALTAYNTGHGINYLGGTDVELNGCHSYANSSGSSGTNHGLFIAGGASNLRVHGGCYAQSSATPGSSPPNTQGYGIWISGGASDYLMIEGALVTPNVTGGIQNGGITGTHNVIRNNLGYNPVGQASIGVGASPFTYRAGPSPEVIYVYGGTVSSIVVGILTMATASPSVLPLAPNESITVTYSAAPLMGKDVQ